MGFLPIAVLVVSACVVSHASSVPLGENPPPQVRTFAFLCMHFCKAASSLYDEDYSDYSYLGDEELEDSYGLRSDMDTDKPRIFCELCKKKNKLPSSMKPSSEKTEKTTTMMATKSPATTVPTKKPSTDKSPTTSPEPTTTTQKKPMNDETTPMDDSSTMTGLS